MDAKRTMRGLGAETGTRETSFHCTWPRDAQRRDNSTLAWVADCGASKWVAVETPGAVGDHHSEPAPWPPAFTMAAASTGGELLERRQPCHSADEPQQLPNVATRSAGRGLPMGCRVGHWPVPGLDLCE